MKFNFIPYRLNVDIAELKDEIQYLATDNGIDLYKAKLKAYVLGIHVSDINFYFFEGSLITVYIHLAAKIEDFSQVRQIISNKLKEEGKAFKVDSGELIGWESKAEFLGLVYDETENRLYLYYAMKKYSIYNL